jgi:tetratricopeptide (TPR) repeat protein
MQVADLVLPRLGAPDWTVTVVIVLALLGLPLAITLAWAFDFTSDGIKRTPDKATQPQPVPIKSNRALWFVGGILVAMTIGWFAVREKAADEAGALDARLIAVLPFRIGGADPSLRYLREGMLDLMAATLVSDDGTHAVDPPTVLARWKQAVTTLDEDLPVDSARGVARAMRAGHVLIGSVIGTPARLMLSLEVVDVAKGSTRRIRTEGSADSLTQLVDRVAGEVLGYAAGEASERASLLAGVPLPAIRAYLAGRKAHRAGDYAEAGRRHAEALQIDSTFVLAGMGVYSASAWVGQEPKLLAKAQMLAWSNKAALPAAERAIMLAELGPHFPEPSSGAELLAAAREAVRVAPERPESYNWVAEWLYHYGQALGIQDARAEAARTFERVLAIDPNIIGAASHLMDLAFLRGDTATVKRIAGHFLERDSVGHAATHMRVLSAAATQDRSVMERVRETFPRMDADGLWGFIHHGVASGRALDDVEAAAAAITHVESSPNWLPGRSWQVVYNFELNRGRPARAMAVMESPQSGDGDLRTSADAFAILTALFAHADSSYAAQAAQRLERTLAAPQTPALQKMQIRCALAQWQLAHGQDNQVEQLRVQLLNTLKDEVTTFIPDDGAFRGQEICANLIDALLAVHRRSPDAGAKLTRLDSIAASFPGGVSGSMLHTVNMQLAQAFQSRGDDGAALRAVRRRVFYMAMGQEYLSTGLLMQARLAAKLGERDAALDAYRHYLALMDSAEPGLQAEVHAARRELSQLTKDR